MNTQKNLCMNSSLALLQNSSILYKCALLCSPVYSNISVFDKLVMHLIKLFLFLTKKISFENNFVRFFLSFFSLSSVIKLLVNLEFLLLVYASLFKEMSFVKLNSFDLSRIILTIFLLHMSLIEPKYVPILSSIKLKNLLYSNFFVYECCHLNIVYFYDWPHRSFWTKNFCFLKSLGG